MVWLSLGNLIKPPQHTRVSWSHWPIAHETISLLSQSQSHWSTVCEAIRLIAPAHLSSCLRLWINKSGNKTLVLTWTEKSRGVPESDTRTAEKRMVCVGQDMRNQHEHTRWTWVFPPIRSKESEKDHLVLWRRCRFGQLYLQEDSFLSLKLNNCNNPLK